MPTVKNIRDKARKILSNSFFTQVGALLFPWVCITSFISAEVSLAALVNEIYFDAVLSLILLFTVLMAIPFVYGYSAYMTKIVTEGCADFSELFIAFSSSKLYFRSFRLFFSLTVRFLAVFFLPLYFIYEFTAYIGSVNSPYKISYSGMDITYTILAILIVVTLTVSSVIFSRYIMACYFTVTNNEKSVSDCFFTAKIYTRHCKKLWNKLATSFIPLILLSVISFGIMFLYTLPLMLTSLFLFAHRMCSNRQINQNMANTIFAKLD